MRVGPLPVSVYGPGEGARADLFDSSYGEDDSLVSDAGMGKSSSRLLPRETSATLIPPDQQEPRPWGSSQIAKEVGLRNKCISLDRDHCGLKCVGLEQKRGGINSQGINGEHVPTPDRTKDEVWVGPEPYLAIELHAHRNRTVIHVECLTIQETIGTPPGGSLRASKNSAFGASAPLIRITVIDFHRLAIRRSPRTCQLCPRCRPFFQFQQVLYPLAQQFDHSSNRGWLLNGSPPSAGVHQLSVHSSRFAVVVPPGRSRLMMAETGSLVRG
jgi:hypothetical protein